MWVFRRLGNTSSPSYQLTLSVLDNVSQVLYFTTLLLLAALHCDVVALLHSNLSNQDLKGVSLASSARCRHQQYTRPHDAKAR